MHILGIETSCDETAAAVVEDGWRVCSNAVFSQIASHEPYGGVVPEIACRAHVEYLPRMIRAALEDAGMQLGDMDAVAATCGPGLASSLMVGYAAGRALSISLNRPFIPAHHLEGHLHSVFLNRQYPADVKFPVLCLLVSGGHSCLVRMEAVHRYRLIGQTMDDAAGEALDKGATLMGLGYPGGPAIEKAAREGDDRAISFPSGLRDRKGTFGGCDRSLCMSFSGLKTALMYHIKKHPECLEPGALADTAASYQHAVCHSLVLSVQRALERGNYASLICVGGVAKNAVLRSRLTAVSEKCGLHFGAADLAYCTDNAAMIAGWAGRRRLDSLRSPLEWFDDIHPNLALKTS